MLELETITEDSDIEEVELEIITEDSDSEEMPWILFGEDSNPTLICFTSQTIEEQHSSMCMPTTNTTSSQRQFPTLIEELCHQFSLTDLRKATNNFDQKRVIGSGIFSEVYKGCLQHDGASDYPVAIKRFHYQGWEAFNKEIELLCQLRHPRCTWGYPATDYIMDGTITAKWDVFTFGFLLLKVVSRGMFYLISLTEKECLENPVEERIDPIIKGKIAPDCWQLFVDMMVTCLKYEPDERPTIGEVEVQLEHALSMQEQADITNSNSEYTLLSKTIISLGVKQFDTKEILRWEDKAEEGIVEIVQIIKQGDVGPALALSSIERYLDQEDLEDGLLTDSRESAVMVSVLVLEHASLVLMDACGILKCLANANLSKRNLVSTWEVVQIAMAREETKDVANSAGAGFMQVNLKQGFSPILQMGRTL
ncbi:hypothetical protein ACSQ67_023204 [Phaseolus vulgaris]